METKDTEIEELIEDFKKATKPCGIECTDFEGICGIEAENWLRTTLHHQLQKAREEAYQAGRAYEAQQCRGSVADNHPNAPYDLPELDQDVNN